MINAFEGHDQGGMQIVFKMCTINKCMKLRVLNSVSEMGVNVPPGGVK
jgi:hypothetical protein